MSALSILPTQEFHGNDGNWSTFRVIIGSQKQAVQVLPASSLSAIPVVLDLACTGGASPLSNCASLRGGTFSISSTGSFTPLTTSASYPSIPFDTENGLGFAAVPSEPGTDTIALEWSGSNVPSNLSSQVIAAYENTWPWLGLLGLRVEANNVFNSTSSEPSLLGTLVSNNYVPSSFWAYTAGASYNSPVAYGSLTFGGYDSLRINNATALTLHLGDTSDDLSVTITRILIDNTSVQGVSDNGVLSVIDSVLAEIWLPTAVCQSFESILGLVWNEKYQIYLINSTMHSALLTRNPTFSFVLGASLTSSTTTLITLPYAAFDLSVGFPYAGINDSSTLRYFPLKRTNTTGGFLGRTFLQEAYVMADYDNKILTVGQALFPGSVGQTKIVTVGGATAKSTGLSGGAIAGIVVGAIAGLALIAGVAYFFWRRRRQQYLKDANPYPIRSSASVGGTTVTANTEMEESERREDRLNEYFKPGVIFPPPEEEHYAKPELDATEVATGFRTQQAPTTRHELDGGNVAVRPSPNRSQVSWGSAISPLNNEERMRSIELHGHPSPEIVSAASSPPMHGRQLSSDTLADVHEMQ